MSLRMWKNYNLHTLLVISVKWCCHFGKYFERFFLNIQFLVVYPRKMKMYVPVKTCKQMFIGALLIIAKNWKQFRCPSAGEWINTMWSIHTVEYYSTAGVNSWCMIQYTFKKILCWGKEIRYEKLHIVLFHL